MTLNKSYEQLLGIGVTHTVFVFVLLKLILCAYMNLGKVLSEAVDSGKIRIIDDLFWCQPTAFWVSTQVFSSTVCGSLIKHIICIISFIYIIVDARICFWQNSVVQTGIRERGCELPETIGTDINKIFSLQEFYSTIEILIS